MKQCGFKRLDAEEVAATASDKVQYRCEDCNLTWSCWAKPRIPGYADILFVDSLIRVTEIRGFIRLPWQLHPISFSVSKLELALSCSGKSGDRYPFKKVTHNAELVNDQMACVV